MSVDPPNSETPGVLARITARSADLSGAELRVAQYLQHNAQQAVFLSSARVAALSGTSDTTVTRAARALGFAGWAELKRTLGAEVNRSSPSAGRTTTRLRVTRDASTAELIETLFEEARERLAISTEDLDPRAFDMAVEMLGSAEQVLAYGVGTSRLCAEYLAVKLQRIGVRARPATAMGFAFADDMLSIGPRDVVIVYAPGRPFVEIEVLFDHVRRLGGRSILVTGLHRNEYDDQVDCVLRVAGSPGGLTGELLTPSVATDALLLALAQGDATRATDTSRSLNRLRRALRSRRAAPGGQAIGAALRQQPSQRA